MRRTTSLGMGAAMGAAIAAGCASILGTEEPRTVECLTSADCGGATCEEHRCVVRACASASDCPPPAGDCETVACEDGTCRAGFVAEGTLLAEQVQGDCEALACNGQGAVVSQLEDADVPAPDMLECTRETCENAAPEHLPEPPGTPCSQGGGAVCDGQGSCGACAPGDGACDGDVPRNCMGGTWVIGAACTGSTPVCAGGACEPPPSCQGLAAGCGVGGAPCCAVALVQGGTFPMGRGAGSDAEPAGNMDETPEHAATVPSFYLDVFPVTVGRFRKFVEAYDSMQHAPAAGAGAKPTIPGSGWQIGWNPELPATRMELSAVLQSGAVSTWTDAPAGNEQKPIVNVTWFEAFAFCVWDGGRLPTEAEWEYAAAGGALNRRYPWGGAPPDESRAAYDCRFDGNPGLCSLEDIADVGSHPVGQGQWGQLDLAGNAAQWVLDEHGSTFYQDVPTCNDCANVAFQFYRVARGGGWLSIDLNLRSAFRAATPAALRSIDVSFRCAREP